MNKKLYISPSGFKDFVRCQEMFYLKKVERLDSIEKGASLPFGSAIDTSLSSLVRLHGEGKTDEGIKNVYNVFLSDPKDGWNNVFNNPVFKYRPADCDFNLFKDGVFLQGTEDHRPLGEYWESLDPLCRWGGRFNDGNHYSIEHEGIKS